MLKSALSTFTTVAIIYLGLFSTGVNFRPDSVVPGEGCTPLLDVLTTRLLSTHLKVTVAHGRYSNICSRSTHVSFGRDTTPTLTSVTSSFYNATPV